MVFWANVLGNQLVWFAAVVGAGRGLAWPGVLAATVFILAQWLASRTRRADAMLVASALLLGLGVDTLLARSGLLHYAAPWSGSLLAPAWILALWAAFAMTLNHSFRAVRRPLPALLLGAIGGPLAYLGAARGWHAVDFALPASRGVIAIGAGWTIALSVLAAIARRLALRMPSNAATVQVLT